MYKKPFSTESVNKYIPRGQKTYSFIFFKNIWVNSQNKYLTTYRLLFQFR